MVNEKEKVLNKGKMIKADLYSRCNAINGKYKVGELGLSNLEEIKNSDIFFLETLQVRANSADRMIAEAESQGKDTSDIKVMKELGKEINALGKPIHQSEAIMVAIFVSLQLIIYYGIVIGIWGMIFKKGFLEFGFLGAVFGFLISLLFVAPVIAFQRTKERMVGMVCASHGTWGFVGTIIGGIGLVVFVIKLIFFK